MKDVMDDKEVGELWRDAINGWFQDNPKTEAAFIALIRKLVKVETSNGPFIRRGKNLEHALKKYDIDPATWPKD